MNEEKKPNIENTTIIREIVFKKGVRAAAERLVKILDKQGKVLATNITEEGKYTIVARFNDAVDYMAFLVAIGAAKIVEDKK